MKEGCALKKHTEYSNSNMDKCQAYLGESKPTSCHKAIL